MKTMMTTVIASAFALSAAGAASAANITFDEVDANGDGMLTLAEVRDVAENVTEEEFNPYDADRNGSLNEAEFDAWLEAYGGGSDDGDGDDGDKPYTD